MILLINNYDSFSYNLYQLIGELNPDIKVIRNDEMGVNEITKMNIKHLFISPGPGRPENAGVCEELISVLAGKIPMLGICLGHQAICETFGAKITYAKELVHGKSSKIHIANGSPVFRGLTPVLDAGRYHSLCADRKTLPDSLLVIAEDNTGEIMGVKHKDFNIFGLQFHPESVLTVNGKQIIENFLDITEG